MIPKKYFAMQSIRPRMWDHRIENGVLYEKTGLIIFFFLDSDSMNWSWGRGLPLPNSNEKKHGKFVDISVTLHQFVRNWGSPPKQWVLFSAHCDGLCFCRSNFVRGSSSRQDSNDIDQESHFVDFVMCHHRTS